MPRIAVLTVPTDHSWALINALVERFGPVSVLAEERHGKLALIRRRMRRQGVLTVLGQIGFVMLQKLIDRRQAPRIAEIVKDLALDTAPNPACEVYEIGSVNAMACRAALAMIAPHVVVVAGTRIIGRQTLEFDQGAGDQYSHGMESPLPGPGGWLLGSCAGRSGSCGQSPRIWWMTVSIRAQFSIANDSPPRRRTVSEPTFTCRPVSPVTHLIRSVEDALAGQLKPVAADGPSQEFFHPTLWSYLWTALRRGIW